MKVTINDREYELKELTKEEARAYIQKEVYAWDCTEDAPVKRKLLEVFMPECTFSFCVLHSTGIDVFDYAHCAPVPEEWYVYETPDGNFFHSNEYQDNKKVDHGPEEYCKQKAKELNEQKESAEHPLTHYELSQLLKCFGVDLHASKEVLINNTIIGYIVADENTALSDRYKIRYKCGEWMPATRETVFKWWRNESGNSDISRFVSFMGWFEDKE